MTALDPRLNAFRPDLADLGLEGKVAATRFVPGQQGRVVVGHAPLRRSPAPEAMMVTEALFGEAVCVFETRPDGWSWVQLRRDRYVGWAEPGAIGGEAPESTHKVCAPSTFAFSAPDIKSRPLAILPLGAELSVQGEAEDKNAHYALVAPRGAVVTQHLAPLGRHEADWVSVAERFVGTPYLWGGKTAAGIDCSGLVQVAMQAAGMAAPRDSDMQEASVGMSLAGASSDGLRRGDLVFWKGHVGIMRDPEELLHANAHHMAVASEPLAVAIERAKAAGVEVSAMRRTSVD